MGLSVADLRSLLAAVAEEAAQHSLVVGELPPMPHAQVLLQVPTPVISIAHASYASLASLVHPMPEPETRASRPAALAFRLHANTVAMLVFLLAASTVQVPMPAKIPSFTNQVL